MITVTAYDSLVNRYVLIPARVYAEWISTYTHYGALISVSDTPASPATGTVDFGWMVQGKEAYGALRDKNVSHLSAYGDVTVVCNSPVTSVVGSNLTAQRVGGQVLTFEALIPWGTDYSCSHQWESGPWFHPGLQVWYRREHPNELAMLYYFFGDVLFVVKHKKSYDGYRGTETTPFTLGLETNEVSIFRRSGTNILSRGTLVNSANNGTVLIGSSYKLPTRENLGSIASSYTTGGTNVTLVDVQIANDDTPAAVVAGMKSALELGLSERDVWGFFQRPSEVDFGLLSLQCADQLKLVDKNILFLIFDAEDMTNWRALWKQMFASSTWHRARRAWDQIFRYSSSRPGKETVREVFKPLTSMYLFTKYGVLTAVSDIRRLVQGVVDFVHQPLYQRLHSRQIVSLQEPVGSNHTYTAVLTVECGKYPDWVLGQIQRMIAEIKRWGVYPRISDIWDIIPYSFVVDWFIQFGDLFDSVADYLDVKDYFPVKEVISSEKWEYQVDASVLVPEYGASGQVHFKYYTRWISQELPLPPVTLEAGSLQDSHLVEATALILQRRPR